MTDSSERKEQIVQEFWERLDTDHRMYRQSGVALSVTAVTFATAVLGWTAPAVYPTDSCILAVGKVVYALAFVGAIVTAFTFLLLHFLGGKYEAHSRFWMQYAKTMRRLSEEGGELSADRLIDAKRQEDDELRKANRLYGWADRLAIALWVWIVLGVLLALPLLASGSLGGSAVAVGS